MQNGGTSRKLRISDAIWGTPNPVRASQEMRQLDNFLEDLGTFPKKKGLVKLSKMKYFQLLVMLFWSCLFWGQRNRCFAMSANLRCHAWLSYTTIDYSHHVIPWFATKENSLEKNPSSGHSARTHRIARPSAFNLHGRFHSVPLVFVVSRDVNHHQRMQHPWRIAG